MIAALSGPGGMDRHMLGASGAVMAVVTLYTLFYPRREIYFFFLPMPMWVLLGIYLVFPLFGDNGRVAYQAHLMGAAFAFCFKLFDLRWSRLVTARIPPSSAAHLHAYAGRSTPDPAARVQPGVRRKPGREALVGDGPTRGAA